jgi:hypothetical protein
MGNYVEATIGGVEESGEFVAVGNCDVWVSGLTSGSVKLQVKFPNSSTWRDVPEEEYTADIFKTLFISEHGARFKLVGVSANSGVYIRMAKGLND